MYLNNTYFAIYEFRYKNKRNLPLVIYARCEETADKVLYWWNLDLKEKEQWYKPRFHFKKRKYINVEPYVIEQEQIECAEEFYCHRKLKEENSSLEV